MENDKHHLAIAQSIVDTVEREHRGITPDERRRAERALERVREIRDNKAFRKTIEDMNGSLKTASGGGFGSAVISSGWDLKSRPSVDVPVASILTKANDFPDVGEWAPTRPITVPLGQDKRFLYPSLPTHQC